MKSLTIFLFVFSVLISIPAGASYGLGKTERISQDQIPERFRVEFYEFFKTDLRPPARGKDENFFIIWRGNECDTRLNIGLLYEVDGKTHKIWFDEGLGGSPGYFNMLLSNSGPFLYGLTLADYHHGYYHSVVFRVERRKGKVTLIFEKKVKIPLPKNVNLH